MAVPLDDAGIPPSLDGLTGASSLPVVRFGASRRGGRVVEGARLESVYTETYRGFESLLLRQKLKEGPVGPFFDFEGVGGVDNPVKVANTRSGCRRRVPESCNARPWAFHRTDRNFSYRKPATSVSGSP